MVANESRLYSLKSSAAVWEPAETGLPWIALILIFAIPLLARLYLLYIPVPMNPDEAQWTVSARSVLSDPIVWRSTDMQTSGPLNALAISWPTLFGVMPSILTSRLTGLLLQSLTLLGMASFIRRGEALSPGMGAMPAVGVLMTLTEESAYVHYSSELVSVRRGSRRSERIGEAFAPGGRRPLPSRRRLGWLPLACAKSSGPLTGAGSRFGSLHNAWRRGGHRPVPRGRERRGDRQGAPGRSPPRHKGFASA